MKPIAAGVMVFFAAGLTYFKTIFSFGVHFSTAFAVAVGAAVGIIGTFWLKIVGKEDGKLVFGNANIFKFLDND